MSSSKSIQRVTRAVSPSYPCVDSASASALSSPDTQSYCLPPQGVHSAETTRQGRWRGRGSHTWAECWVSNAAPVFYSRVKTTCCGLKSTLFNRLDVCDRLVVVQALGWGGVTWQRSCRTMCAVENIGICTNFHQCQTFFLCETTYRGEHWIFSISSQHFYLATRKLVLRRGRPQ